MSATDRIECLALVREAQAGGARKELACELLGVTKRTLERWETRPEDMRRGPTTKPGNALTAEERRTVLAVANNSTYANLAPAQIVPALADLGHYLASESTFYRILKSENLLNHRSKSSPRKLVKPEALMATGPNQLWSWDITFLRANIRGLFYYLFTHGHLLTNDRSLGNPRE